jgi:hypothetical protein
VVAGGGNGGAGLGGSSGGGGVSSTGGRASGGVSGTGGRASGGVSSSGGRSSGGAVTVDAAPAATGGLAAAGGTARGGAPGTGGRGTGGARVTDAGVSSSGGKGGGSCSPVAFANEANDYAFSHAFTFPPVKVQPKSELTFDWSEATADLIGHAIDPKRALNTILVFEWNLTLESFQSKLDSDTLVSNDMTIKQPLQYETDGSHTSAKLFEFTFNGNPIGTDGGLVTRDQVLMFFDPAKFDPTTHVFTVMAASGSVLGQGTRMIQAFQLDPNSTNTVVKMTPSSANLAYKVDLHTLAPTPVPAASARLTIDWSKLATDALGAVFYATDITHVVIGHYKQSPSELEAQFLDLQLIAVDFYEGDIDSGTKADLSQLRNAKGTSFAGIDSSGTWLLGLQCGGCRSPAPLYLTILKPCNN